MTIEIPAQVLHATRLTPEGLLLEAAVMLFQKEKRTLGQAAALAGLPQHRFQWMPGARDIPHPSWP